MAAGLLYLSGDRSGARIGTGDRVCGYRGSTATAPAAGLGRPVPSLEAQRCGLARPPPRPCSSPSTAAQRPGGQPPAIGNGPAAQGLEMASEYVQGKRGTLVPFTAQPKLHLRVGGLEGTLYEGQDDLLRWCQALYLPQPTRMVVVGTVDDVPCLATGQQLLILVAESSEVYAYEEETLHKVARSLPEFLEIGLQLLGKEVYRCGEHIVPLDEEERDKDPTIQKIRQNVNEFIKKGEDEFHSLLELLDSEPAVAC
ncbi:uncharacterized protein LOC116496492 [Aythya fuligula]|uniref:Uncharacterized protein LOC116496492 n=1 Tax=Aythya fuligula TaxID=219594 RepID=A0A6J3DXS9_AYTFU|nr:uncharacterized protein LOC116496492 [Aythya fuligula]